MSVAIRAAGPADEGRCQTLLELLSKGAYTPTAFHETFTRLLDQSRGRIVVADEDGFLLGMATVSYNLALRYDGEYCQLEELIVDPVARGKNVGGLLVQQTIADARSRGCGEYGLYLVERTEHNRPFYEKYGLEAVGTEMRMPLGQSKGTDA